MNHEMDTNILLSLSEGDIEMVSYIYTKTFSRVWINTPQKILLNIQEMESLRWNIHNQTPPPEQPHWVQNHNTVFVCYQPKKSWFWYFLHYKYLDSH